MKNIAVLTSGRADYSIYYPILRALEESDKFDLHIIAFGMHLSQHHGYSIDTIKKDGFKKIVAIDSSLSDDKEESVAISMGITQIRMAELWKNYNYDLLICIGDRYEMFSAVASSLPFNIKTLHIHGGEKTLGAIDNSFRHAITSMSDIHLTSCEQHKDRVIEIIEKEESKNVYNVGSPSLDGIKSFKLLTKDEFINKFKVNIKEPTILFTYHPETKNLKTNIKNIDEIIKVFSLIKDNILVTLPNNDPMGSYIRKKLIDYSKKNSRLNIFNYLGINGYFSAMKHCEFMMGNSSSGIIEAASFGTRVINIGDRQKGRFCNENVLHCKPSKNEILKAIKSIKSLDKYNKKNIYYKKNTIKNIINIIEKI